MTNDATTGGNSRLSEQLVKVALEKFDWPALRAHFDAIALSRDQLAELCGLIRRYSDLVCKYPRKAFEERRKVFLDQIQDYALRRLGADAGSFVALEIMLIAEIEQGYRHILDVLARCAIGQRAADIRVSGIISRACYEFQELMKQRNRALAESKELNFMSDFRLRDSDGRSYSPDAVLDGLSESVAMTLIMEAYRNDWFVDDIVELPRLPEIDDEVRDQSGATQALALYWRQWQRLEKRRRFLGGEIIRHTEDQLPAGLPPQITTLIEYRPQNEEFSDCEMYDYLANARLNDRLLQTFLELEIETGMAGQGVGIANGAALPPAQLISVEEVHACVSLSELLGYSIAEDSDLVVGLRLIEWVRGYIVLKEIAKARSADLETAGDGYAIPLEKTELVDVLQKCGLEGGVAEQFISLVSLHRSSRDMFDCPLVRIGASNYLLFAPAVIDLNVAMAVLSNLSNRGAELSRKGKAFEESVRAFFRERGMQVFNFKAKRAGEEYEYDAVVPWGEYLFVFECKNRSLSGNDPVQIYYFDLEVASQAKQVQRLAAALAEHQDIIEQQIGAKSVGLKIIPCVLHSLPYSRVDDLDGVYFTDWSALKRFFVEDHYRIKVPHRIGNAIVLHRTAIRGSWESDTPTAEDFLRQLRSPFQLELLVKHLDSVTVQFAISHSEIVVTPELVRTEMTARSVSEAAGADPDGVLHEIAAISEQVQVTRLELQRRTRS